MTVPDVLAGRLLLVAADLAEFDALIAGDARRFAELLDVAPPDPFRAPPLTDDVLDWFRDRIAEDPAVRPWLFRWMVTVPERQVVGSLGFAGPPDEEGAVTIGYSVYPEHERRGHASAAVATLVDWALAQPGVQLVRATIRPDNPASQRVATRAGLRIVGRTHSHDEGILDVWERSVPT